MGGKRSSKTRLRLFRLEPGYNQRGYSPWHQLEANLPQARYRAFFSDQPLAAGWRPVRVELLPERKAGDFFYLEGLFVATARAVAAVQAFLGDKVEALPLRSAAPRAKPGTPSRTKGRQPEPLPPLFLLHPLESVELSEDAEVERFDDGRILDVDTWAFAPEAIAGKHFFSVRGLNREYIVSESFRDLIEREKLEGLSFHPLPGYPD